MAAFEVSEKEFARLEALKAMQETGQMNPSGAEVAGDALIFGKRLVLAWIISGAILFLVGLLAVLPWMLRGFSQLDAQNARVSAEVERAMSTPPVEHHGQVNPYTGQVNP